MNKVKIELGKEYILLKGINYKVEKSLQDNGKILYELILNEGVEVSDIYIIHNPSLELFRAVEINNLGYIDRWSGLGKFMY